VRGGTQKLDMLDMRLLFDMILKKQICVDNTDLFLVLVAELPTASLDSFGLAVAAGWSRKMMQNIT